MGWQRSELCRRPHESSTESSESRIGHRSTVDTLVNSTNWCLPSRVRESSWRLLDSQIREFSGAQNEQHDRDRDARVFSSSGGLESSLDLNDFPALNNRSSAPPNPQPMARNYGESARGRRDACSAVTSWLECRDAAL